MNELITHVSGDVPRAIGQDIAHAPEAAAEHVSLRTRLPHGIPTAVILLFLVGLGFWGHHTGWKLSKFWQSDGNGSAANDWCAEHGVPESLCVECNAELAPRVVDHGWCRNHGVHNCPLEHPDVAQLAKAPRITPAILERAERALATKARVENDVNCPLYRRRVQFESEAAMAKAGVDTALVEERAITETISANGEVAYDPTRVARLGTPVPGRVWRVEKHIGDAVHDGEVLALIDSAEVGKAKAEFLQAHALVDLRSKSLERQRTLVGGAVSPAQFQEAEASLREAQIRMVSAQQSLVNLGLPVRPEDVRGLSAEDANRRLQFLGLPDKLIRSLDPSTTTANLYPVKAPFGGVLVSREAAAGEVASTATPLFVVVDPSRMWLTLHVRLEDVKHVTNGQHVRFRTDAGGVEADGQVDWISPAVDKERTRTVQVRVVLSNPNGRLRAGAFGTGQIILREEPKAVMVPNEAVHWDGSCHVVFARDKDFLKSDLKVFHTRSVRPGVKDDKQTEIIVGLLPGEVVASKGSAVLRAELLKNNLGAC